MTLNPELYLVVLPALCGLLGSLGGTQISDTIKGQKWLRRFLMPAILGLAVLIAGFAWFQALGVTILGIVALSMGYGDRASWGKKLAIFALYGCISLPIGCSAWNIITFVTTALMFLLSNLRLTAATVVWKIVEGCFSALIGIQVAFLLAGNGLIWRF